MPNAYLVDQKVINFHCSSIMHKLHRELCNCASQGNIIHSQPLSMSLLERDKRQPSDFRGHKMNLSGHNNTQVTTDAKASTYTSITSNSIKRC